MAQTFSDLINLFGGYSKLAEAVGRPEGTVSSWKTRNSIPPEVWSSLVDAAERLDIKGVSLEVLAELAEKNAHRRAVGSSHDDEAAA